MLFSSYLELLFHWGWKAWSLFRGKLTSSDFLVSSSSENPFSEVVVLFLCNLHRSGPGCFFMCCDQGKTFVCLSLRMLHRMCPSVFISLNAVCWVSLWCGSSEELQPYLSEVASEPSKPRWCFTCPLFLHSQAACWQSEFCSGRQVYLELYLSWELPFSFFQHRSPPRMGEGHIPPGCWWAEFCQEHSVFSEGYVNIKQLLIW